MKEHVLSDERDESDKHLKAAFEAYTNRVSEERKIIVCETIRSLVPDSKINYPNFHDKLAYSS